MADLPKLDVVIGNNFGHLPMFIGPEKGFFRKHGVDAKMLVVDTGTDMVNAMHDGRAQIGDMSTTTYLKAVHAGEPLRVIGLIMNDATRDNCDDPLAIVTKKGRGIEVGKVTDLKGKKIGLARGQTSDEYFKMVLRRAKMKYEELTIENIRKLIHPDDWKNLQDAIKPATTERHASQTEFRVCRPNGELRWCIGTAVASIDATDHIVRVSGVTVDITGRKEAEEHQALLAREVDHRRMRFVGEGVIVGKLAHLLSGSLHEAFFAKADRDTP